MWLCVDEVPRLLKRDIKRKAGKGKEWMSRSLFPLIWGMKMGVPLMGERCSWEFGVTEIIIPREGE